MVTNAEINNEKTVSEKPIVIRHKKKYARKKTTAKINSYIQPISHICI